MAQPVYDDEGPLDEYLRMTGEGVVMPGSVPEFTLQHEHDEEYAALALDSNPFYYIFYHIFHSIENMLQKHLSSVSHHQLAEPFKYTVISSTLLSTSLPQNPLSSASTRLQMPPHSFNRDQLSAASDPHLPPAFTLPSLALVLAALAAGYYLAALLIAIAAKIYSSSFVAPEKSKLTYIVQSLDALDALVDADTAWIGAVGEAMAMLEKEDGMAPLSPTSSLRVSLHSCFQTTTTQCDNIRQLFSPLTALNELSQLAEMYAPSFLGSLAQTIPLHTHTPRPSIVTSRSTSLIDKRSTWAGAPSSSNGRLGLGIRATPLRQAFDPSPGDLSPSLQTLSANQSTSDDGHSASFSEESEPIFGTLALQVQKANKTPQRQSLYAPKRNVSPWTSPTAGSRFTSLQKTRNPLSLASLSHVMQSAMSSKRYACSHLLALRFEDVDDEAYWENVRSVIGLLTSTLEDETAHLVDAIETAHSMIQREQMPSIPPTPNSPVIGHHRPRHAREFLSFAPLPSSFSKFTIHMIAIKEALDKAYDNLDDCMAKVRVLADAETDGELASSTMQAFESLRRELGIALLDCERARDPLLGVFPKSVDSDTDEPAVPPLAHDHSSSAADSDSGRGDPDLESPPTLSEYISRGPAPLDEVSRHLLAGTSAAHLPPPGLEQLFEAESGPRLTELRGRSTLSRTERIALMKAKRESIPRAVSKPPSGEIVEELKQVINKVNERKKQRNSLLHMPSTPSDETSTSPTPLSATASFHLHQNSHHAVLNHATRLPDRSSL